MPIRDAPLATVRRLAILFGIDCGSSFRDVQQLLEA